MGVWDCARARDPMEMRQNRLHRAASTTGTGARCHLKWPRPLEHESDETLPAPCGNTISPLPACQATTIAMLRAVQACVAAGPSGKFPSFHGTRIPDT